MLVIALTKMKIILKDKAAIGWMLLAPILFITVIVYGFEGSEGKCNVCVVDQDQSFYTEEFIKMLRCNEEYPISVKNMLDAKTELVNGTSIAIIKLPKGYEKMLADNEHKQSIQIVKLRDNNRIIAIKNIVDNTFNQQKVFYHIADIAQKGAENVGVPIQDAQSFKSDIKTEYMKKIENSVVEVETMKQKLDEDSKDLSSDAVGIMVMFIMFFIVNSSGMLMDERNIGILDRISISTKRRSSILLGQMLGLLFVGWIQVIILVLVGKFIYQINWGNTYLGLFIIFTSFLLSVSALGTLISCIAKNRAQIIGLIAIIVMPTSLLGGCMWSKDMMSDTLLKIANFTPQSWVLDGITNLVLRQGGVSSIYKPSLILCCFTVAFLLPTYLLSKMGRRTRR